MKYHIPRIALIVLISGTTLLGGCSLLQPEAKSDKVVKKPTPPVDLTTVKITPDLSKADVKHNGEAVTIQRIQDEENRVNENFAKTSRKCPPFCIKPFTLARGVETIGELEVIDYAVAISKGKHSMVLVDARSPEWLTLGTIPSSINIPYSRVNRAKGAIESAVAAAMKQLGVVKDTKGWNFKKAKTVIVFCNGMWSDQSADAVEGLLKEGYPAKKIKWYRGGIQSWENLGLTVFKPKEKEEF